MTTGIRSDTQRAHPGCGLRTDPEKFSKALNQPTRVLLAQLNQLIVDAGLNHKELLALCPELRITYRRFQHEMSELTSGPSDPVVDAILSVCAPRVAVSGHDLAARYAPLRAATRRGP